MVGIVVGVLFLLSMFFSPIAGIVPANATAPALIIVGYLMMATLTAGETMAEDEEGKGLVKRAISAIRFGESAPRRRTSAGRRAWLMPPSRIATVAPGEPLTSTTRATYAPAGPTRKRPGSSRTCIWASVASASQSAFSAASREPSSERSRGCSPSA